MNFGRRSFRKDRRSGTSDAESLNFGRRSLNFGRQSLNFGRRSFELRTPILELRTPILPQGSAFWNFGRRSLNFGRRSLNFGRRSLNFGRRSLNFGRRPSPQGSPSLELRTPLGLRAAATCLTSAGASGSCAAVVLDERQAKVAPGPRGDGRERSANDGRLGDGGAEPGQPGGLRPRHRRGLGRLRRGALARHRGAVAALPLRDHAPAPGIERRRRPRLADRRRRLVRIGSQGTWRVVHGILAEAEEIDRTTPAHPLPRPPRPLLLAGALPAPVPQLPRQVARRHRLRRAREPLARPPPGHGRPPARSPPPRRRTCTRASRSFSPPTAAYRWDVKDKTRIEDRTVRPYVVQYNESDFDFVARLLEDEGLSYYFEHGQRSGRPRHHRHAGRVADVRAEQERHVHAAPA